MELPFTDLKKNSNYDLLAELKGIFAELVDIVETSSGEQYWCGDLGFEIINELQRRQPHAAEKI